MPCSANQEPTFIDNFLGYNAGRDLDTATGRVEMRDTAPDSTSSGSATSSWNARACSMPLR